MCASLNEPCSGDPRWPLVPKATRCAGSSGSGRRSKYSRLSRDRSTSISFGASLPASGEMVIGRTPLWHRARFGIPDLVRILRNGAVAGELSRAGDVQDRLAHPSVTAIIQLAKRLIRFEIRLQIRQMHVVIAMREQRVM